MGVEYDPEKSRRNIQERGLSFDLVNELDWASALFLVDDRKDYGERRYLVFGTIRDRLHVAVVTPRKEDLRVISLRRANGKEVRLHEREIGRGSGRAPG